METSLARDLMSDEEWAFHEPFVRAVRAPNGRKPVNHRIVLDGIFWIARTGAQASSRFGPAASGSGITDVPPCAVKSGINIGAGYKLIPGAVEKFPASRMSGGNDMELGVYSFGDVQRDPRTGALGSTAEAQRNLLEAIQLADQVGLDYFGIGEHHTREMPASAATSSSDTSWMGRYASFLRPMMTSCRLRSSFVNRTLLAGNGEICSFTLLSIAQ